MDFAFQSAISRHETQFAGFVAALSLPQAESEYQLQIKMKSVLGGMTGKTQKTGMIPMTATSVTAFHNGIEHS